MTSPIMTPEILSMSATLASYEGMFGPYNPQTLAISTALAVALCGAGRQVEGKRLLERAVMDLTRHHGPYHPVRIRALEAWSALLCQERDWKAALPVQRELLDCRTHLLGQDHPQAHAIRNDLSATLSLLTSAAASISA
jgi:eukaryotic-like serine/threonine-protein kinase